MALSPQAKGNLSRCDFQLTIQFFEEARMRSVVLASCNITGVSESVGNDGSALVTQYTLQPLMVLRDGHALANLHPVV